MARVRPSAKGLYPLTHFVGPLICLKIQSITAEPPFPPALVIKSLHRQKVGGKTACAGGSIPCQRGVCLPVCLPPRCAQSLRTFVCAFYSADSAD